MLDIIVCDDSRSFREKVKNSIIKYSIDRNVECTVSEFTNGEMLLESVDVIKADTLIFMDYKLGDKRLTGIQVVEKLREMGVGNKVVFLTAYPEIVYDTFKVGTYRFLTKPLIEEGLFEVLDSYRKSLGLKKLIKVKVGWDIYQIVQASISHIESKGKKSIIYYGDDLKRLSTNCLLYEIEKKLDERAFYRCHKSFIVNVSKIIKARSNYVELEGGITIPVGRGKFSELVARQLEVAK